MLQDKDEDLARQMNEELAELQQSIFEQRNQGQGRSLPPPAWNSNPAAEEAYQAGQQRR